MRTSCRAPGSTSSPRCRPSPTPTCTRRPASRSARTTLPAVPDGPDRPGGLHRRVGRHPRAGARHLPAVAADPADPGPRPGARPRTPARIYYKYEAGRRPAPTSPTPPSPRPSTTRPRGSPGSAPRPAPASGERPGLRLCPLRPGVQGLHGPGLLRRQAVPALDHGDLGGERHPVAVAGDQRRPRRARPGPGLARVAGHRHLRGGRGRRHPGRHPLCAGQRAQPCPAPPDRDRARAQGPARAGRGRARRAGRLRRRRVQLRRVHLPAPGREARRPPGHPDGRGRAHRRPHR